MNSLKEFFNRHETDAQQGIAHKNNLIKRNIIACIAVNGKRTLAELSRELHISIPTITKLIGELLEEKIVTSNGKMETHGGRRPTSFGLANSAIYFVGVEVSRDHIGCVVTDLKNNVIASKMIDDFQLEDNDATLDRICDEITDFVQNCGVEPAKLLGVGLCITGRVNPNTGRSYKYFTSTHRPLREILEERLNTRVLLENDTRARCYAEYIAGNINGEKNLLYLHLGKGVAIGIIIDGKVYYGKSGFAGEFGHAPFFDNEIICSCGKKGCLETEVSGIAIERNMVSLIGKGVNTKLRDKFALGEQIHVNDIIAAAKNDDTLSIELIEEVGEKIGRSIAFLINIFNPELVIVGGNLADAGDFVMLPLQSATNKYSLNLVYKDTQFRLSKMGPNSGAHGAAVLMRNQIIGL
jgi:predicted NBD/HSP70 family sugar kinase